MKNTVSIRHFLLAFSVLLALTGLPGIVHANSEGTNTVVSHGKSENSLVIYDIQYTRYEQRKPCNGDLFKICPPFWMAVRRMYKNRM
jgi:hypothetical protein